MLANRSFVWPDFLPSSVSMIGAATSDVTVPSTIILQSENLAIDSPSSPASLLKGISVETNRRLKEEELSSAQSKSEMPTLYVPSLSICTSVYVAGIT